MQQWLLAKSCLDWFGVLHGIRSAKPTVSEPWQHSKAEHHPLLQRLSAYFNLGRLPIVTL